MIAHSVSDNKYFCNYYVTKRVPTRIYLIDTRRQVFPLVY